MSIVNILLESQLYSRASSAFSATERSNYDRETDMDLQDGIMSVADDVDTHHAVQMLRVEADEARDAGERELCVLLISKLYQLFDTQHWDAHSLQTARLDGHHHEGIFGAAMLN